MQICNFLVCDDREFLSSGKSGRNGFILFKVFGILCNIYIDFIHPKTASQVHVFHVNNFCIQ